MEPMVRATVPEVAPPLLVDVDRTRPCIMPSWIEATIRDALRQRRSALQCVPRVWFIEQVALVEVTRAHVEAVPTWALDGEARHVVRAAQDQQRAVCGDAAESVDVIMDPAATPEAKHDAWLDLHAFVGGDLGIDVAVPPPSIFATSNPAEVRRIDPPNYYEPAMTVLRSRGWSDGRATWPVAYIKRATYRAAHRYCVRALQRQRRDDEIHVAVDKPDVESGVIAVSGRIGPDATCVLDALRASGRPEDRDLADDIETWLGGTGKAAMGDARYQRMRHRLRRPRMRALAQRLGIEPVPRSIETQVTGVGAKKTIVLSGGMVALPFGTPPPNWQRCYRTQDSASLW